MNDARRETCLACGGSLDEFGQPGDAVASDPAPVSMEPFAQDLVARSGPDADTPAPARLLPEDAATIVAPFRSAQEQGVLPQPPPPPLPPPLAPPHAVRRSPLKRQLLFAGLFLAVAVVAALIVWRVAPGVIGDQGGGSAAETVHVTPSPSLSTSQEPSPTLSSNVPSIASEMEAFLQSVEPLIRLSGKGMDQLAQATVPSDPAAGAPDAIQFAIDNRTEVSRRLGSLIVPDDDQARACRSALTKAMTYALQADNHYLDWANGDGDKGAAVPDSAAAAAWKGQFVRIYNRLAAQYGNGMRHDWTALEM
jgi:hypothetical protein